jgi:YegS/Rv2252/BmrU family lipid kinase
LPVTGLSSKRHILFVVNSLTAKESPSEFRELVGKHLDRGKFDFDIIYTKKEGHGYEIAENAVSSGIPIITAVGGDGTINEVARAIVGSDIILGIIPHGSGNGLARHLKIPLNLKNAIASLNDAGVIAADSGTVNNQPFFNIAGVGFDARVANLYRKSGERGFKAYVRIITTEFLTYKPRSFILDIDGEIIQVNALFISFANTTQYGYNTIIAPEAKIDDGSLDVVIFEHLPLRDLPRTAPALLNRKIYRTEHVRIFKAKDIMLTRTKGRMVNIDGESFSMGKQLHIQVCPKSLRLMVPADKN